MRKKDKNDALSERLEGLSGLELGMELCEALLAAVGRDGFHGGVRPDNITVGGIKPVLGQPLSHGPGEFSAQELEFMSPELFWNGERSPAADVYSLGLTLYAVYNGGRLPFWPAEGEISDEIRSQALQRRMRGEDIAPPDKASEELSAVILRALAFRPEERWRDAEELRDALGDCSLSGNAAAAVASISLAGSPLDRPEGELSEIEKMMAEIIAQGQGKEPLKKEPAPATEPEPIPEPPCEKLPEASPETSSQTEVETVEEDKADEARPKDLLSEEAATPPPPPVLVKEQEPVHRPEPTPVSESVPAPRRTKKTGPLLIACVVCVGAALLLYFLLRSFAFPAGEASEPMSTPGKTPAQAEGSAMPASSVPPLPSEETALPVMSQTPTPMPSPTLAPTATPAPSRPPSPTPTPTPSAAPSPTPSAIPSPSASAEKYRVIREDCSWEEARRRCEELGGHLAVARNQEEFDALVAVAEESGVNILWLGAQRQADGTWLWVTGEEMEFFAWDSNEPSYRDIDGTEENCLLLWKVSFSGGSWAFNDCRNDPVSYAPRYYRGKIGYICQFD